MEFSYSAYAKLLHLLKENGYNCCNYRDWNTCEKPVILRHDIDNSPRLAARLSDVEKEQGVQSTFFALISSEFYNPFEKQTNDFLKAIRSNGSEIGLHFDEKRYEEILNPLLAAEDWTGYRKTLQKLIRKEADLLSAICEQEIVTVSMHRPSARLLEQNLEIDGMINSYSNFFFKDFKYLSDSRRHWREPVEQIISSNTFAKVHILTHAFWYREQELSMKDTIRTYIRDAAGERYEAYRNNFRDLDEVLSFSEIEGGPQ